MHVPETDVVRWAREGLADEDQAIALTNLAHFRTPRMGPRGRCALCTVEEVRRAAVRGYLAGRALPARLVPIVLDGEPHRAVDAHSASPTASPLTQNSAGAGLPADTPAG